MQGRNIRTRIDIALCIMAMYTIESEIYFRKLTILGQLCRLNIDHWLQIVFLNRLCSFDANNTKHKCFISDIVNILGKYGLLKVLVVYKHIRGAVSFQVDWHGKYYKK